MIFTCFSEVIKMCSKETSINCSSGLPLSEGWGANCPGWFILPSAQDLVQTGSSVNSYCIIILEYLVVRDVNIISVKLRCLHLTFSLVILVPRTRITKLNVRYGGQAVQASLSCPQPRIWVKQCHQVILIAS